jgi:hypothetical protein
MRDRPIFSSEHPDDAPLTDDERAEVTERLRLRAELQAAEDDIPEVGPRS